MIQQSHMPEPGPREEEQRVLLHNVTWAQYESLREATDHIAGLRLTYLDGTLEIMSPSSKHERIKKLIARLVEAFADETDLPLNGFGSTTYREPELARALDPDECYVLGDRTSEIPDLAIEVIVSRGGIDKLAVYQGLGVREVWFWVDAHIRMYALGEGGYAPIHRSTVLPEIDTVELAGIIAAFGDHQQREAVREFRNRLRARRRS